MPIYQTNWRPVQASGRLVKMKLPAASAAVLPEQPVGFPASSTPRNLTPIPGNGDSMVSDSTTRPKKEVVTGWIERFTFAVCVEEIPSTVAAAEMVKAEVPTVWFAGAVTVRMEICPAAIWEGDKVAVIPEGRPLTLSLANWVKPSALARLMEKAALSPWSKVAAAGPAVRVKLEAAVTFSAAAEVAVLFDAVTVMRPLAAPAGMTKEILVGLALETGAAIVPPPCWLSVTCAVLPLVRFAPVNVMSVPTGPDFGLKSVIAGCPPLANVMESRLVAVLPATSVALTVMLLAPATRLTEQLNAPACNCAAMPLQEIDATPERASLTVPDSCRVEVDTVELLAGEATAITGGVLSIFNVTCAVAVLPALSVAVPEMIWFAPSVLTRAAGEQAAIPERASEQLNVTVTLLLFHPAALAAGFAVAVMVGGTLSTPIMSTARIPPGAPLTWTSISLEASKVTGLSTSTMFWFRSFGATMTTPFTVIVVLETKSVGESVSPPLCTRKVNCVLGFSTVKLSVTVTGAPLPRTYVFGAKTVKVPLQAIAENRKARISAGKKREIGRRTF